MYQLLETIKIVEGKPQNLQMHTNRMNRSRYILFGCNEILNLSDLLTIPETAREGMVRCRVIYSFSINSIEFSPYSPVNVSTLKIVEAGTLCYDHKYLDRSRITALIDKRYADDILISRNGYVTDASFANIVFTDGIQWITPDKPLLCGTMRELLLSKGVINSRSIKIKDLPLFTHFRLINAMLGFGAPIMPIGNIINPDNV